MKLIIDITEKTARDLEYIAKIYDIDSTKVNSLQCVAWIVLVNAIDDILRDRLRLEKNDPQGINTSTGDVSV